MNSRVRIGTQQWHKPSRRHSCVYAAANTTTHAEAVRSIVSKLLSSNRGVDTKPALLEEVKSVVRTLQENKQAYVKESPKSLSATWKLVWTTEKETLFILEKAGIFGTKAGDVFQVIDIDQGRLQNVVTFPPEGAFIVNSTIAPASDQRLNFEFTSAKLNLPGERSIKVPPFGQGWFDTIYLDDTFRVATDSRGDILIVSRDGPPRVFN